MTAARRAPALPDPPPLREAAFMRMVTQLAEACGWQWSHFRPARTQRGWRTPVSGPLGAGWPDLVLARPRDRRLIFAELKADRGRVSPEQDAVLTVLGMLGPGVEACVWRPRDWDTIEAALR